MRVAQPQDYLTLYESVTKSSKLMQMLPQVVAYEEPEGQLSQREREGRKTYESLKIYVYESLMTVVSEGAIDFDQAFLEDAVLKLSMVSKQVQDIENELR